MNYAQVELFARGKLVMLRTCNQLLRRLSKVVGSLPVNGLQFIIAILQGLSIFYALVALHS